MIWQVMALVGRPMRWYSGSEGASLEASCAEDDETEVERDQLVCFSLQQRLSRRESLNGQEVC